MVAIILLIIGTILFFRGKITIGSFTAQGKHVKDAGIVLMLPAAGSFFLGLIVGVVFMGNLAALVNVINILLIVELIAVVIAIRIAYRLIVNPVGYSAVSTVTPDWQTEAANASAATPAPAPITKSILTLDEAAQYLGVTTAQILELIDTGKLPAARVNYRYQIARSVLDELREEA